MKPATDADEIVELEQALHTFAAAGDRANVLHIRLRLARCMCEAARIDEARTHAELALALAQQQEEPALTLAAGLLRADLTAVWTERDRRLDELEATAVALNAVHRVRLRRGLLRAAAGQSVNQFVGDLVAYLAGRTSADEDADQLARVWLHDHPGTLERDHLVLALEWSRRGAQSVLAARLLVALDRRTEALEELRRLTELPQRELRRSAMALLVAALPIDAHSERRRWCDALAAELGDEARLAEIRLDLATALFVSAEEDPARVDRAWAQAELAWPLLADERARAAARSLRGRIRMTQLSLADRVSTPEQAARAAWLVTAELPDDQADAVLLNGAISLLRPGPLCHPACLAQVRPLLARVRGASGLLAQVWRRLAWIDGRRIGDPAPAPDPRGPYDAAPDWLIALIDAPAASPAAASIGGEELRLLGLAIRARPDRADTLLDWISQRDDIEDLDTLYRLVELGSQGPFPVATARYVERLQARRPAPRFDELREQHTALMQSRDRRDDTALGTLVEELGRAAATPEERVEALYHRGVYQLRIARGDDDESAATNARAALTEAANLARSHGFGDLLYSVLISLGNAWRSGPARDLEYALAYYEEAERLPSPGRDQQATLWKVTADALLARAGSGDAARSLALLERSLTIRDRGWLRAETLMSAARAELAQDGDEGTRHRRALTRLEESLPHADAALRAEIGRRILTIASRLLRLRPGDTAATGALTRLESAAPELAAAARYAFAGASHLLDGDERRDVRALLAHPAYMTYTLAIRGMYPERHDTRMLAGLLSSAEQRAAIVERAARKVPDRTELLARADTLAKNQDPVQRPGALLARAEILAYLAARGEDTAVRARDLAGQAEAAIDAIADPRVRVALLLQLASLWAPTNHVSHPVRDFARSAAIAERALALVPADSPLASDATGFLARATRYRSDGDPRVFIERALRLYEQKLRMCERRGDRFGAEQAEVNLEEARSALGHGGEVFNLERSIRRIREIVETQENINPTHLCALARNLTLWGCRHRGDEADRALAEGQHAFASLFARASGLGPGERKDAENYQCIGRAAQAERAGDWATAIDLWRRRLAEDSRTDDPARWATTAHNLADNLVRAHRNLGETLDAVRMCEDVLAIRRRIGEPIHLWETHHLLGDAVRACIPALDLANLGADTRAGLWFQGRAALVDAMDIARGLGGGERLFRSGFVLALLACLATKLPALTETAESAWQAMDEARPFLLHREDDAMRESAVLAEIAALTATMHARNGPIGDVDGCAFVLGGEGAWGVSRWLVRATGCTQRRLNARWRRPVDVDPSTWTTWIAAVRSGDPLRIAPALAAVRAGTPDFLSGEPTLAGLSTWLRAAPDAAAFVVLPTRLGLLAAIYDGADELRCHVAALTTALPQALREQIAVEADEAPACYDEAVAWGRSALVAPLVAVHARLVRRVLWCVSGPIRGVSPHDLWPGVSVTLASDPAIHTTPAPASLTTAIVVADPGAGAAGELPGIVEAGAALAREVVGADLRVRLGRGAAYGRVLGLDCPGLLDAPPEPDGVLQDLVECKRIVILCHGVTEGVDNAAVLLLDAEGREARLDLRRIAEDPRSFAGATVLLLACETGRAGPWIHRAAGFPGVLLACGARRILAPLWPVFCDVALTVGRTVLRALDRGTSPADVLAELVDQARVAALTDRHAWRQFHSLRAFTVWDG
ncbi:MAG: CHAT domain-containing protein [Nannocystis sp.]|nr:CHAT domain-containing protein [Nannocystis sp.]